MRLERYRYQPRSMRISPACGCLTVLSGGVLLGAVALALILPQIPGIPLRLAGFQAAGDTDDLFTAATPAPAIDLMPQDNPPRVLVTAGDLGQRNWNTQGPGYSINTGMQDGLSVLQAQFDEDGLLEICRQYSEFCETDGYPLKNARFDLRSGGVIVSGEVYIEPSGTWQRVNIVITLTQNQRVAISGVDVNGTLYTVPPAGMGDIITQAESMLNDTLQQLTVQSGSTRYRLSDLYISDDTLTLIMR